MHYTYIQRSIERTGLIFGAQRERQSSDYFIRRSRGEHESVRHAGRTVANGTVYKCNAHRECASPKSKYGGNNRAATAFTVARQNLFRDPIENKNVRYYRVVPEKAEEEEEKEEEIGSRVGGLNWEARRLRLFGQIGIARATRRSCRTSVSRYFANKSFARYKRAFEEYTKRHAKRGGTATPWSNLEVSSVGRRSFVSRAASPGVSLLPGLLFSLSSLLSCLSPSLSLLFSIASAPAHPGP